MNSQKVISVSEWRCAFCGCDSTGIRGRSLKPNTVYCSEKCSVGMQIRREKSRLHADPEKRRRKREQYRNHYHRQPKRVHADRQLRKLQNPLARIAKSHRNRLQELIKKGAYVKSGASWDNRSKSDNLEAPQQHLPLVLHG